MQPIDFTLCIADSSDAQPISGTVVMIQRCGTGIAATLTVECIRVEVRVNCASESIKSVGTKLKRYIREFRR
jgi:hypothetical protein